MLNMFDRYGKIVGMLFEKFKPSIGIIVLIMGVIEFFSHPSETYGMLTMIFAMELMNVVTLDDLKDKIEKKEKADE